MNQHRRLAPLLNQYYPEHVSAVLAAADAACRNETFPARSGFHLPAGYRLAQRSRHRLALAPPTYQSHGSVSLVFYRPADLRLVWELNRHQHFITLGIAYWLTGEQQYVDAFSSQIQSWIETNPLQHGVNWYYGLEISIRLLAWTVAFQFFRNSSEFRAEDWQSFSKELVAAG